MSSADPIPEQDAMAFADAVSLMVAAAMGNGLSDGEIIKTLSMTICAVAVGSDVGPDDVVAQVRADWPTAALAKIEMLTKGELQ